MMLYSLYMYILFDKMQNNEIHHMSGKRLSNIKHKGVFQLFNMRLLDI